jgi:TolB-like protein/tetratricopeptide (TPR) repeat protein
MLCWEVPDHPSRHKAILDASDSPIRIGGSRPRARARWISTVVFPQGHEAGGPSVKELFNELKRRKVFRVAVVYVATAFVILQAADIMLPRLGVPDWAMSLVVALVVLGLPLALVLAWALELTPDGVRVTPAPTAGDHAQPPPSLLGRRTLAVAATLVVLGVGLGAGWLLKPGPPTPDPTAEGALYASGSVAVLPFDNFAVEDEDYFSDGITEDIIAQLTRVPDLTVISRTSAMRYRNTELSVREIGAELGVGAILEGSVRRADGRVRIVAQLIDVATDTHLWAETYDREMADIFAVQSEVAREIASALGRTLSSVVAPGSAGREHARTDPETYELYLRARHLWNQRRPAALRSAIQYFEEAIARDPAFALAHAGLADAYLALSVADPTAPAMPSVESAMAAGRRALELDPTLGEAYAALGLASTMAWAFEDAEEYFARALDLTPGYATAHHWAGAYRAALGQTEAAVGLVRRALELDPFSPRIHQDLANRLHEAGRLDEAIQVLERGAELDPGFPDYYLLAWWLYASAGEEDRALEALLRAHALAPASGPSADAVRAAFRDAGLAGAIRLVLERAPATFHSNIRRARAEVYVGDTDAALRSLERMVEGHDALSAWILANKLSEPLGDDPRYRALVRRVGIPGFR